MNCHPIALALAAIIVLTPVTLVYGQTSTQPFGCQRYGDSIHCDLLLNEMQAYEVIGNSTLVHPLTTSETIFVDGKLGRALEMRGEYRESIEIMNVPELNPTQFSVSFWVKPTRIEPYGHIVSHSNRAQTSGWQFDVFSTSSPEGTPAASLRFGVFNSNGTLFSPADILVPTDAFTHIAGTFDGSTVRVYENGELVSERELVGSYTADPGVPLRIGSAAYCSSCNRWSGMIDEVRMYNTALGEDQIRQTYSMSDIQSDLIGHWKFDGDTEDALGANGGTSTTMLTSMTFAPDGRLFFTEKNTGAIRIMTTDGEILDEPFVGVGDVYASWEQGMLGLALDPDFETNRYLYVYYSALVGTENGDGGKVVNRVLRFTDSNNTGTDMQVIIDDIPASRGYHSGGAMAFGPDGKLYITVGDATEHIFAQDPAITLGKILRVNKDGTIPEDNPYPGSPVYTIGHRNMYGIAFDSGGTGLITENGDFHYDEINLIEKGGNYGFPTLQPPNLPPERADNDSIKPLRTYWDAIAPTQMIYYDGDAVPELRGMFLFGSFTGDIYAIRLSDNRVVQEIKVELSHYPFVPTVAIAQSPDGEIYYGGYQIYRLDSVNNRTQTVFTVQVDAPDYIEVANLQVRPSGNGIRIDVENLNGISAASGTTVDITAKIPKNLLDQITFAGIDEQIRTLEGQQVAIIDDANIIDYKVNSSNPDYNIVTMSFNPALVEQDALRLIITGSYQIPEFALGSALTISIFSAVMAMIIIMQRYRHIFG